MPTLVTATRFNNLRGRIASILGSSQLSAPQFGYGQTLTTPSNVVGNYTSNPTTVNLVENEQYRDLYIDIVRARIHQIGATAFTQQPFPVGSYSTNEASTDKILDSYITGLESLMTTIETNKFSIFESTQASLEPLKNNAGFAIVGTRNEFGNGPWNTTLSFIFTVNFTSEQARREFFNAGGQVRISSSHSGSQPNTKTQRWAQLLSNIGSISFAANNTYSTVSYGTGSAIGNYGLTGSYQLLYRGYASVYTANAFEVYALQTSGTQIQFRVYLADNQSEGVDEGVFGNFTVSTNLIRPQGTATINGTSYTTVTIATPPVGAIVTNLIAI